MRYGIEDYIILNKKADSGQWDGVIGEVLKYNSYGTRYIIDPLTLPLSPYSYDRATVINVHSFEEYWVNNKKSDLLNYLLGRS